MSNLPPTFPATMTAGGYTPAPGTPVDQQGTGKGWDNFATAAQAGTWNQGGQNMTPWGTPMVDGVKAGADATDHKGKGKAKATDGLGAPTGKDGKDGKGGGAFGGDSKGKERNGAFK